MRSLYKGSDPPKFGEGISQGWNAIALEHCWSATRVVMGIREK